MEGPSQREARTSTWISKMSVAFTDIIYHEPSQSKSFSEVSSSNKQNGKTNSALQAKPHLHHVHPIHHSVLSMNSVQQLFFLGASCSFSPDVLHDTHWKLLMMICGVKAVPKSALSSLYSPLLDVYRRQKGWLIPSVWTHKAEESSHFSTAREKSKIFYYEAVINVWRDKGCTLALKKCGVIPSTQNSNEQSLFLQVATAVVSEFPAGMWLARSTSGNASIQVQLKSQIRIVVAHIQNSSWHFCTSHNQKKKKSLWLTISD